LRLENLFGKSVHKVLIFQPSLNLHQKHLINKILAIKNKYNMSINATVCLKLSGSGIEPVDVVIGNFNVDVSLLKLLSPIDSNRATTNSPKELLTTEELALHLKKSISTIRDWKRSGKIPFQRVGRSVFFELEDVLDAIKNGSTSRSKINILNVPKRSPPL
jgi:excisionase family DNA binding protein